jgi:hypothetical protein
VSVGRVCSRILSPKRRLPVLQSKDGGDSPPRPRWQWVGFGAVAILVTWLPLAYVSQAILARMAAGVLNEVVSADPSTGTVAPEELSRLSLYAWLLPTGALFLSGALGGYVLARWGDRSGRLEAAEAGGLVALFAMGLSWARSGLSFAPAVALLVVVPAAVLGASLGRRMRPGGLA